MKISDGIPVPKPLKDPSIVTSYRPVAITLLYSRILEVIITLRTQRQIALVTSLHPRQFGFRRGLSTTLPVMALIEQVLAEMKHTKNPDSHRHSRGIVFAVDFTDAFCRVSPTSIDRQLEEWKVPLYLRAWIRSFLTNRQLRTFVAGVRSKPVTTPVGCPQGSILGPFLWLVVMESLLRRLDDQLYKILGPTYSRFGHPMGKVERGAKQYPGPPGSFAQVATRHSGGFVAYADDLTIWLTDNHSVRLFTDARKLIETVCAWAVEQDIQVSAKTEALLCLPFNSTAPNPVPCELPFIGTDPGLDWERFPKYMVTSTGVKINFVEEIKFLGIRMDKHMRADPHVYGLISSLTKETMTLGQSCHFLIPPLRAIVMGARIGSKARYLLSAWWNSASSSCRDRLEGVWADVAKEITGAVATTQNNAVLPEARMRPLAVEAELMAARVAPSVWKLGVEYSFLKTFEGSSVMDVPDIILNPGIRRERKRIRENHKGTNKELPRYLQEHNWLQAQSCHKSALDEAARKATTEKPTPQGLQAAPTNLLADLSGHAIFKTVADTKWLTTLDPMASLSERKLHIRKVFAAQLEKELRQFSKERLLDVPDDYDDDDAMSSEVDEDAPRTVTGDIGLKTKHNAAQLDATATCCLQIYTDASIARIPDPKEVEALQAQSPINEAAIRKLPRYEASGGAFVIVKDDIAVVESKCSLGPLACSYSMERETILLALSYLLEHAETLLPAPPTGEFHEVALITDSLSTLSALECNGPFRQTDGHNEKIWRTMIYLYLKRVRLHMTFVYSHLGVKWNERADMLATEALSFEMQGYQWPLDIIRPCLEKITKKSDEPEGSLRPRFRISGLSDLRKLEFMRLSATNWKRLLQLRTDACPLLGGHLARMTSPCSLCGQPDALARGGRAVTHLFECPGARAIRETFPQYRKYIAYQESDRQASLAGKAPYICAAEQKERDRNEFTPKLLWSNPKVALRYFEQYLKARDELTTLSP